MKLRYSIGLISLNLLLLSFGILISCGGNGDEQKTDLEKENLKGDVVLTVDDYGGWDLNMISYDSIGNEQIVFSGSKQQNFYTINKYKYLDDKLISITSNGTMYQFNESIELFEYDDLSRLIKRNSQVFRYDDKNRISYDSTWYGKIHYIVKKHYYKDSGQLDSTLIIVFLPHNLGEKSYTVEKDNNSYSYSLNNNGVKNVYKQVFYKNNEFGDLDSREEIGEDGRKIETYKYSYDKNNNWTKKETFEGNKLISTINRKVFYKGDDISFYLNKMEDIINYINKNTSQDQPSSYNSSSEYNSNTYSNQNSSVQNNESERIKCRTCNGTGKCRECGKTFSKEYYKGNGSYEKRNETKPGYVMCNDCWGRGHKQIKRSAGGWEPGGDCYVSDCQDGWKFCRECNSYGKGNNIGQCKECKGTSYRK
jgi:hypothetical protein